MVKIAHLAPVPCLSNRVSVGLGVAACMRGGTSQMNRACITILGVFAGMSANPFHGRSGLSVWGVGRAEGSQALRMPVLLCSAWQVWHIRALCCQFS